MALGGIVAGLGALTSVAGTVVSFVGQSAAAADSKEMRKQQNYFSQRAEAARNQQMLLEAQRQKRAAFRQGILARSSALAAGVNQGAGTLSSGVEGGIAQAVGTSLQGQQTSQAASTLGQQVFEANRQFGQATYQGENAIAKDNSFAAIGGAISSFGGAVTQNAPTISRVGTYFGSKYA